MSRFGFIATKKLGKATKRNRAVRVLREAVRTLLPDIAQGFDVVVVAHARTLESTPAEVVDVLRQTLKRYNLL